MALTVNTVKSGIDDFLDAIQAAAERCDVMACRPTGVSLALCVRFIFAIRSTFTFNTLRTHHEVTFPINRANVSHARKLR